MLSAPCKSTESISVGNSMFADNSTRCPSVGAGQTDVLATAWFVPISVIVEVVEFRLSLKRRKHLKYLEQNNKRAYATITKKLGLTK